MRRRLEWSSDRIQLLEISHEKVSCSFEAVIFRASWPRCTSCVSLFFIMSMILWNTLLLSQNHVHCVLYCLEWKIEAPSLKFWVHPSLKPCGCNKLLQTKTWEYDVLCLTCPVSVSYTWMSCIATQPLSLNLRFQSYCNSWGFLCFVFLQPSPYFYRCLGQRLGCTSGVPNYQLWLTQQQRIVYTQVRSESDLERDTENTCFPGMHFFHLG